MSTDPYPRSEDESLHLMAEALDAIRDAANVFVGRTSGGATRPPVGWAVLELLGHRREVGYLSEVDVAGRTFLRLATPVWKDATEDWAPEGRTLLISTAAIYAITPTTEQAIREEIMPWIACGERIGDPGWGHTEIKEAARPPVHEAPQLCGLRRGHDGDHDPDPLADLPF